MAVKKYKASYEMLYSQYRAEEVEGAKQMNAEDTGTRDIMQAILHAETSKRSCSIM